MSISQFDHEMMLKAIRLAEQGMNTTTPNPRVGCVIVSDSGEVIGQGYHRKAGEGHAEVNALADAEGSELKGATVYVTLEPCSHHGKTGPCAEALINANVARVVFGMEDPNPAVSGRGFALLREAGISVEGPVEEQAVFDLNIGFVKRMREGLPYVRVKSAMSLDGRTAMASGESKWITGPKARADVQQIRARSCAIITGVDSVIHDDPSLTVRLGEKDRQPLRIVMDTKARCPKQAEVLGQPGRTIIAIGESTPQPDDGREYWVCSERDGRVDPAALLRRLAAEGCNEVLVETGATLAGSFVGLGLVDEYIVYIAAKLMGSSARPLFDIPIRTMSAELPLTITDIRAVGDDWKITAIPDPES